MIIHFLITISLIAIGTYFLKKHKDSYEFRHEFIGVTSTFLGGSFIFVQIIALLLSIHKYDRIIVKKESIEYTLNESRKIENNLESATIMRDVLKFNSYLNEVKYNNSLWWCDPYIDDRIETIEMIK